MGYLLFLASLVIPPFRSVKYFCVVKINRIDKEILFKDNNLGMKLLKYI